MDLGTIAETDALLKRAGYATDYFEMDFPPIPESDKVALEHRRVGDQTQFLEMEFTYHNEQVELQACRAYLLDVPIAHTVHNGIDTRELDERMKQVDWSISYDDEAYDIPTDRWNEAMAVYHSLSQLSAEGEDDTGEALASLLAIKHWPHVLENNRSEATEAFLQANSVQKTYGYIPHIENAFNMKDELNIDPRETDYFDDYDMAAGTNFIYLEKQLLELGFTDQSLINALRKNVFNPEKAVFTINCRELEAGNELRTWFEYDQLVGGDYKLRHFETLFSINGEDISRLFEPDITRDEAVAVLYKDKEQGHDPWAGQNAMSRKQVEAYAGPISNKFADKLRELGIPCLAGDKPNEIWLKRVNAGFEHVNFAGIDTRKLHEEMRAINWMDQAKSPAMDKVFRDLQTLGNDYPNHNEAGQSLIKWALFSLYERHFSGTPVEKMMLAESPYNKDYFYQPYRIPANPSVETLLPMIAQRELLDEFCRNKRFEPIQPTLFQNNETVTNYDRLRNQLSGLGFTSPHLDKYLRLYLQEDAKRFCVYHERDGYETLFEIEKNKLLYYETKFNHATQVYTLNQNTMNDQNLSYLQKNLLNLGFGEKLNEELEQQLKAGKPEFKLETTQEYNGQNVDYTLHFKAGDDRYFFNKYDASLQGKDAEQTIFLNKGYGYSAKEAYNLLEGRSVYKQFTNLEQEKYHLWAKINFKETNERGTTHKLDTFSEGWNYRLERGIDKIDLVGMDNAQEREKLFKSLEKGNRHQVTAKKDGEEVKIYLEANPADHRINVYNAKGVQQKLETYKKPELKNDKANTQSQQQKEELPAKKSRKQGAKQHL